MFFFTSVISVVTGSTSLITVPVMIALGIEAHVAVATNMLALTFMSIGGSLPFMGKGILSRSRLLPSIGLTIIGSGLGALLLLTLPLKVLQISIAMAMIGVAAFSLLNKNLGQASHDVPASRVEVVAGYAATFPSRNLRRLFQWRLRHDAYCRFCTAFRYDLSASRSDHKGDQRVFFRRCDSGVCLERVVDLKLGVILGVVMFLGALLGGRIALLLSAVWLRRIFIAAVLGLAAKLLSPVH